MQHNKPKVFIIAGEVSGDILGARIISAAPDMEFVGVGGENMIAAGMTRPLFPMGDLAVMGVAEVVANARTITRRIKQTVRAIIDEKPDLVLTIDSPGFAKSVIKALRKSRDGREMIARGLRFHHVVAPQVWAWRSGRAEKYAKIFDKLYAFFDFEVPYFTKYGLDTVAVGHPIADGLVGKYKNTASKTIALIPGSRMSEVKRLLPLYRDVVAELDKCGFAGYRFVIPTVETTAKYIAEQTDKWPTAVELVPAADRYDIYAKTFVAIAASGTVSAELAMLHVPTVVVYRMNPITVWLARRLIKIKWVSLVNILLKRGVYPELLGGDATVKNIVDVFYRLANPATRRAMIATLKTADERWRHPDGDAAALVANGIRRALIK